MSGNRKRTVIWSKVFLSIYVGLVATSCGSKKDFGENLALNLKPTNTIVGPGPTFSCLDRTTFSSERSVTGPLINFNNFVFQWTSDDTLIISSIRITVTGSGISGGESKFDLPIDEVEALLGLPDAVISGKMTIQSRDPQRGAFSNSSIPACGLVLGPLSLTNGTSTASFKASVLVEVIGTGIKSDETEYFVKQEISASAEYISF